jgi:hypothetical protein
MRNNQPNKGKGSNEAAATIANNQPNTNMERHHCQRQQSTMVTASGKAHHHGRKKEWKDA